MRIVETYSHLNGEEYLLARSRTLYNEIREAIGSVDASACRTKRSREKTMYGRMLYAPKALNREFKREFHARGWSESRYSYCVTTNRQIMEEMVRLPFPEQKQYLKEKGIAEPIHSYKQTDFVKNHVAVEVQFGKYPFVAFDLFVKHLLFYSGGVINVGVEVLPMKSMSLDPRGGRSLSSGIGYFEGEVYNVLRHGRTSPPVPLLLIGIDA